MTDTIHTQPELSDDELLRVYGLAKRDHNYEGSIDDWPKRAERAATVAGLRAAIAADRARAALVQPESLPTHDLSNVAPLLWVLWNHLGARSPVGQPIREYLGMGQFQPMTDAQMAAANQYRALLWNSPQPEPEGLAPQPVDGEVAELVTWLRERGQERETLHLPGAELSKQLRTAPFLLTRAADLLERLAPQQGTASDELLIQAARRGLDQHHLPTELGYFLDPESIEYEPLLLMLRAVVQCQPALPQPIPVAERLPGPGDCTTNPRTGQGQWCWGWTEHAAMRCSGRVPYSGRWRMMRREWLADEATHWLPAHALPIPSESV